MLKRLFLARPSIIGQRQRDRNHMNKHAHQLGHFRPCADMLMTLFHNRAEDTPYKVLRYHARLWTQQHARLTADFHAPLYLLCPSTLRVFSMLLCCTCLSFCVYASMFTLLYLSFVPSVGYRHPYTSLSISSSKETYYKCYFHVCLQVHKILISEEWMK